MKGFKLKAAGQWSVNHGYSWGFISGSHTSTLTERYLLGRDDQLCPNNICATDASKTTAMNHCSNLKYLSRVIGGTFSLNLFVCDSPSIITSTLPPPPASVKWSGTLMTQSAAALNSVFHPSPGTSCTTRNSPHILNCFTRTPPTPHLCHCCAPPLPRTQHTMWALLSLKQKPLVVSVLKLDVGNMTKRKKVE